MRKLFRSKTFQRWVLIAVVILILPAFVYWGTDVSEKKKIQGKAFIGTIGDKKITLEDFLDARKGTEMHLVMNFMGQKEILNSVFKDRALINDITWKRLIMLEAARKQKVNVPNEEVVSFVVSHPYFTQNGVFDQKIYSYLVRQNFQVTEREFEERLRESLAIAKLNEEIVRDVTASDEEALLSYKREFEKGKMSYIHFLNADFEKDAVVSQDDIRKYYHEHINEFIIPDQINFEYMEFPFMNTTERDYIIGMAKEMDKKIKDKPAAFEETAKEKNRTVEETGLFFKTALPAKFSFGIMGIEKIFRLKPGEATVVTDETATGSVYLVRVKEKIASSIKKEEEVSSLLEAEVKSEKAKLLAKAKSESVMKAVKNEGVSLDAAAEKAGTKVLKTELVSRFDYLPDIGPAYDIADVVFSAKIGSVSGPFETQKGYVLARLDELQEIDKADFDKKKEEYRNKVLGAKKDKALEDWLRALSGNSTLIVDLKGV